MARCIARITLRSFRSEASALRRQVDRCKTADIFAAVAATRRIDVCRRLFVALSSVALGCTASRVKVRTGSDQDYLGSFNVTSHVVLCRVQCYATAALCTPRRLLLRCLQSGLVTMSRSCQSATWSARFSAFAIASSACANCHTRAIRISRNGRDAKHVRRARLPDA